MVIEKKAIPELFEKVLSGEKTFDARLDRFECKPGDILVLKEWDPTKEVYTGRRLKKKVTFILKTKDLEKFWSKEEVKKYGFQIIAFK
jgi:ribosomal protein S17